MTRSVRFRCLLFMVSWCYPAATQVAPVQTRITWRAPDECPGQNRVIQQVEQTLGQPLAQPREHTVSIDGGIHRLENQNYLLRLVFRSGSDLRIRLLQHDNCVQLTEGAVLVMAMAIDPERVRLPATKAGDPDLPEIGASLPSSAPRIREAPRGSVSPTTQETQTLASASPIEIHASVNAILQAGLLPNADPAIGGELGLSPLRALRVGVTGIYGFPVRVRVAEALGSPAEAEFDQWGVGARGCWQNARSWFWATCIQGEVGRIRGRGRSVADPQSRTDGYGALLLGLEAGYPCVRWLRIGAGLSAGALLARPQFSIQGLGEVHRPAWWLLRANAGVTVEFR